MTGHYTEQGKECLNKQSKCFLSGFKFACQIEYALGDIVGYILYNIYEHRHHDPGHHVF